MCRNQCQTGEISSNGLWADGARGPTAQKASWRSIRGVTETRSAPPPHAPTGRLKGFRKDLSSFLIHRLASPVTSSMVRSRERGSPHKVSAVGALSSALDSTLLRKRAGGDLRRYQRVSERRGALRTKGGSSQSTSTSPARPCLLSTGPRIVGGPVRRGQAAAIAARSPVGPEKAARS